MVWITCALLWCFYELFGLSFWRHPFTAEDPLLSKWCNAEFLQICSHEETNSSTSWMAWGWVQFQQIFFFWGELFFYKVMMLEVNLYFGANVILVNTLTLSLTQFQTHSYAQRNKALILFWGWRMNWNEAWFFHTSSRGCECESASQSL